ncbi:hypothetical protein [Labilibaculum euxinus]|uniref:Uncharacterized protein n=1 Tax=Labilibaculum euxinus TaxID=2686357 RepID=A0A7M4D610_9BACT|nr:hypothetical protein [Labilibaculum euxinus]MUP38089.1 hypothetical protein [Labilibaculum euxinus]MVB07294.1 hypothetical protein [Labilibaculum euxinus]
MKESYLKELEKGRLLVYGISADESIKECIQPIYSEERIELGKSLYTKTKTAFELQNIEGIESSQATREFNGFYTMLRDKLIRIRKVGRYFFKNDLELSTLLRLNKEVPAAYPEWKALTDDTVSAIVTHEAIQEKLTLASLMPDAITALQADLVKLDDLKLKAEKEDGEAQQATAQKQEYYVEFMAYCSDLRACLDLFYEGSERQKLEVLGIVVK